VQGDTCCKGVTFVRHAGTPGRPCVRDVRLASKLKPEITSEWNREETSRTGAWKQVLCDSTYNSFVADIILLLRSYWILQI
jgi:hypothetical protein